MGNCLMKQERTFTCQDVKNATPVVQPCVVIFPISECSDDCECRHCNRCGHHETRCTCQEEITRRDSVSSDSGVSHNSD